jgi:hypothetical protein
MALLLEWLWLFCGRNALTAGFMAGTGAALAFCFAGRRVYPRFWRLGCWTAAMWAAGIALHHSVGPGFRAFYPAMDFILAIVCLSGVVEVHDGPLWRDPPPADMVVLCALVSQMVLHVLFPTHRSLEMRYPYLVSLNVLYAVHLFAMAWPGMRHVRDLVRAGVASGLLSRRPGCPQ